jgi:hypothetical protein
MTKYSPEQNAQARFVCARLRAALRDIQAALGGDSARFSPGVSAETRNRIARLHLDDLAIALAAYDIVSDDGIKVKARRGKKATVA